MSLRFLHLKRKPLFWLSLAFILALIAGGSWMMAENHFIAVLQYFMPLASFVLAWFLVSLPGRIVNHKGLLVVIFLALVAMGIHVYSRPYLLPDNASVPAKIFYPINNTLSGFFPSRGDFPEFGDRIDDTNMTPESDSAMGFTFEYYLFHYLSFFFLAWVGFSLFGRQLLNRVTESVMSYKHKDIFWGYSEGGYELAKDIIATMPDEEPIFLLDDGDDSDREQNLKIISKLSDRSIVAFNVSFDKLTTEPSYFRSRYNPLKIIGRTGRYFGGHRQFFITEDQDLNVKLALTVLRQLKELAPRLKGRTVLYIRTEQAGIDTFFQEELASDNILKDKVGIRIFSQSDLTARRFVESHPVLALKDIKNPDGSYVLTVDTSTCTVRGSVEILMLGLGWTGFDLLNKIVADAAFGDGFRLSVTVVDDDYRHNHGRYQFIVEEARRNGVEITINPTIWVDSAMQLTEANAPDARLRSIHTANGQLFYRWLYHKGRILKFSRIIVALGNDELNINTALDLNRFRLDFLDNSHASDASRMPEKIMAHVRNRERYPYYNTPVSPIITFGSMSHIYTSKVLIAESMDTVAKMVNYVYSRYDRDSLSEEEIKTAMSPGGDAEKAWNRSSLFDRDSSRAVALNIRNIIEIAGGDEEFARKVEDPASLDRLGMLEHLRWNAFHFMRGIKPWDIRSVSTTNGKLRFSPGNVLVRHICLVPFDMLDEASLRVSTLKGSKEDFKASDRRIVRHFNIFKNYLYGK